MHWRTRLGQPAILIAAEASIRDVARACMVLYGYALLRLGHRPCQTQERVGEPVQVRKLDVRVTAMRGYDPPPLITRWGAQIRSSCASCRPDLLRRALCMGHTWCRLPA